LIVIVWNVMPKMIRMYNLGVLVKTLREMYVCIR